MLVETKKPRSAKNMTTHALFPKSLMMIFFVAAFSAHPYLTFTSVSVSPFPVVLPGYLTVGLQAIIHRQIGREVKMAVKMDKQLLGEWTKFPCSDNFGSWCDILYIYLLILLRIH